MTSRPQHRHERDRYRAPTLRSIAESAGVSPTTVSHVISGNRPVALETRQRIERLLVETGFLPNTNAQALRSHRSMSVGLLFQDADDPLLAGLTRGLTTALHSEGEVITLLPVFPSDDGARIVAQVRRRRFDAVVLALAESTSGLSPLLEFGIPLVSTLALSDVRTVDSVTFDNTLAGSDATEALLHRGHDRIVALSRDGASPSERDRVRGYRSAMRQARLVERVHLAGADHDDERTPSSLFALLELERRHSPTAVFCTNSSLATQLLDEVTARGVRVPDDLAVIVADSNEALRAAPRRLSRVELPDDELGRLIGRRVLRRIAESRSADEPSQVIVPHRVHHRGSS